MPLRNKKRKMDSISPFEKGEKQPHKCDSTVAVLNDPKKEDLTSREFLPDIFGSETPNYKAKT